MESLDLKPGFYRVTRIFEPNVVEVNDMWFIKLKNVNDTHKGKGELSKWLQKGHFVKIVPYKRSGDARIISDVWLGNIHINKQLSAYVDAS